jgi:hypothetical protein
LKILIILFLLLGIVEDSNLSSSPKQLKSDDFNIYYNEVEINDKVNVLWIKFLLGFGEDFENNNNGYVSGFGDIRRWQAEYPNSQNPELRLTFLTTANDNYLVFAELNRLSTNRGIKAGDSYDNLIRKYGESQSRFEPYPGYVTLRYTYDKKNIDFVFSNENKKIDYIIIDYNSFRADKEQEFFEE